MNKSPFKGFTLIEMLVALAILSLIVAIGMSVFDGSRSKAQALVTLSKQMADANIMAKEDIGCFAKNPVALFDQTAANTGFACKANVELTRIYMPRQTTDDNTTINFAKVADDVQLSFRKISPAGLGSRYVVDAENVPTDILKHALAECNGNNAKDKVTDMAGGDAKLGTYKCIADSLDGDKGRFTMQYAETR